MWYKEFLPKVFDTIAPKTYLEIGFRRGYSLSLPRSQLKIAIDPNSGPESLDFDAGDCRFYRMTSDDFFKSHNPLEIFDAPMDCAFIDGLHLFEFALRDLIGCEKYSNSNTFILIDDVIPADAQMASRRTSGGAMGDMWAGDVWKLIPAIKAYRPDLWRHAMWVRSRPTGCLILTNPDCENTALIDNYDTIVATYLAGDFPKLPSEDLLSEAIQPLEAIRRLEAIVATRKRRHPPARLRFARAEMHERDPSVPMVLCVTRFNLPHPSWQGVPDDLYCKWLEQRYRLFEEFTLPSMRNCYVKPDFWVVLTSREDLGVIERLGPLCRGLPVKFVRYQGLSIRDAVRKLLSTLDVPNRLMTVRLDADDMVSADFFARLKKDYGPLTFGNKQVVSFPLGAVYVAELRKFFIDGYVANPFIALVEDIQTPEDLETVYLDQHHKVHSLVPIQHYLRCQHPTWASVVHDCNLANNSLLKRATFSIAEEALIRQKFGLK